MATRKLDRSEWERFFDEVSKNLKGVEGQLEVVSEELGDQTEVEWAFVEGISYDPKDDVFEIQFSEGKHDHLIQKPVEVFVEEEGGLLKSVEILKEDGTKFILRLKPAPALPG
ncbi:MAG: hypothetical protein GXO18_08620 [Aquificae bacterium]|nr:hypothetical protein [Aquificota bacterium]